MVSADLETVDHEQSLAVNAAFDHAQRVLDDFVHSGPRAGGDVPEPVFDAVNLLLKSPKREIQLLAEWVVMELFGLSETQKVIFWRFAAGPPRSLGTNSAETHTPFQLGEAKSRRALAEAFAELFTALPGHARAACIVSLARLRCRIARCARQVGLDRRRTRDIPVFRSGMRIAALPCTPHAP